MVKYVSKRQGFESKIQRAFKVSAFALGREITIWITSSDWPTGKDIVDAGQLRASQQIVFTDNYAAVFTWNTEYAAPVFLGAVLNNGTVIPARNAPERGLKSFRDKRVFDRLAEGIL